jgi:endo-1,4-beta-xylanase
MSASRIAATALVTALLLSCSLPTAASGGHDDTLRALAARHHGLRIGTAVDTDVLAAEPAYRRTIAEQFSTVTAENVMKWQLVEPTQGQYDWDAADGLVRFAQRIHATVRGHTLVWHNQLPGWLTGGSFTDEELRALLRKHVTDEVSHFRGRIWQWDVVNEAFNEDGTLRDTIWRARLGDGYIADAFRWARRADREAKLYINDYNIEGVNPKSDGLYQLVKRLRAEGVPIDGVGIQGHLGIQYGFPDSIRENLQRFADLGVDVALTEVDVRMPLPVTDEKLQTQADYYSRLTQACLAVRRCVAFTVWGFTDAHSWVPGFFDGEGAACLYDEQLRPKPAYFAVRDDLASRPRRPRR